MKCLSKHICKVCKRDYSSSQSLCNHYRIYHNTKIIEKNNPVNILSFCNPKYEPINPLICRYCYKNFSFRQSKHIHEKICKKNIKDNKEENYKIQPKTLQKINNNYTTNNDPAQCIIDDNIQKNIIIKSDDNNFLFDITNKKLIFNDKPIKYFYYNDQVYFKGEDIACILDYEDTPQYILYNVNIEDRIKVSLFLEDGLSYNHSKNDFFENEDSQTVFINESGFYSLILISQNPEAIAFKKWVTSMVLPSIRKSGSYNIIDNYIEEDIEKYQNKDCVYIIHIKDNIYKYGYTTHIFKRLQARKTNLNYNKIIKIYYMDNMNEAINLETKIKKLTKSLNINIIYNNHVEIFEVDNNNLQNIIKKIDELSLKIINKNNNNNIIIEKAKIKQLELENENLKLKLELSK